MVLGIDFGTTRMVVAAADRGNFPLVSFETPDGLARDWFPPLAAIRGDERLYGWRALPVLGDPDWTVLRSLKRYLRDAGPNTELDIDGRHIRLADLLGGLIAQLRDELAATIELKTAEPIRVMLGVPANANSNQRFLTTELFRAAGFQVLGLLNEPSAASIEFGHGERSANRTPSRAMLVYDLGGGTFDASLVETGATTHSVIATAGASDIGGDDFDEILAAMALEAAGHDPAGRHLSPAAWFRLLEECREKKEALNPNTRRIVVDLDPVHPGWGVSTVNATEFYERCRPLIEQSREIVSEFLAAHPAIDIDTLYVTGGGSELPAVSRVLKETFGRRVRRSSYMRSATAIGLAIAADAQSGYRVRDRLAHTFGVWREADGGENVAFDVLLPGGIELPAPGEAPYRFVRGYQPAHNIGHFRYVECSRLSDAAQPSGDMTLWDEIRFPFDPALARESDLAEIAVTRSDRPSEEWIEEEYSCDSSGKILVRIANRSSGYIREYQLGNWSEKEPRSRRSVGERTPRRRHRHP